MNMAFVGNLIFGAIFSRLLVSLTHSVGCDVAIGTCQNIFFYMTTLYAINLKHFWYVVEMEREFQCPCRVHELWVKSLKSI